MSKPTRIKWAVAEQMMKKAAHDDNSEDVIMKLGRFYYDISNCTEEEVLEFIRESQVRSINKIGATRLS